MNIKELKEAAGKATPGPFKVVDCAFPDDPLTYMQTVDAEQNDGYKVANFYGPDRERNARWHALANPSTILSLIARVEQMEEALRPFSAAAEDLDDEHPDHWHLWEHAAAMSLSAGDLRRARAALETPANPIEEVVDEPSRS